MIVFELECAEGGHRFEGWFRSSDDFAGQQAGGLLCCPQCGNAHVIKAPMAPNLARKGNQLPEASARAPRGEPVAPSAPAPTAPATPAAANVAGNAAINTVAALPPEARAMLEAIARKQAEVLQQSRWVGESFANDARAMHYGDKEHELIHGQASAEEARELIEEGVEIAPILFPVAPPGEVN